MLYHVVIDDSVCIDGVLWENCVHPCSWNGSYVWSYIGYMMSEQGHTIKCKQQVKIHGVIIVDMDGKM